MLQYLAVQLLDRHDFQTCSLGKQKSDYRTLTQRKLEVQLSALESHAISWSDCRTCNFRNQRCDFWTTRYRHCILHMVCMLWARTGHNMLTLPLELPSLYCSWANLELSQPGVNWPRELLFPQTFVLRSMRCLELHSLFMHEIGCWCSQLVISVLNLCYI